MEIYHRETELTCGVTERLRFMNRYLYETHFHTKEASACASLFGADHSRKYKEAGYSGIIVTDHFLNGNSCIPKDLPWREQIERFCKGYEHAKEEGDKIGLDVFFGLEVNFNTTEFLIYGVDKTWLLEQTDMLSWSVEEEYRRVKEAGGFIVHAHPFRSRSYIREIKLYPDHIDAVEIFNSGNSYREVDEKAEAYAEKLKLPVTSGTDAHGFEKRLGGMAFPNKLNGIRDFIDHVKDGKGEIIRIPYNV